MLQSRQFFNDAKFQQVSGDTVSLSGNSSFSKITGISNLILQTINSTGATANTIIDPSFIEGSGFDQLVNVIKYQADGKMIVGGSFTHYTDSFNAYITRFNTNGTTDTTFKVGTGADQPVYAIAIQTDNKIIIGGSFQHYSGVTKNYIVRLNSDGSIDNSFVIGNGFNNGTTIQAIAIQSDGKILVGGSFTTYSGVTISNFIRLNTNGGVDSTFHIGSGFDVSVIAIAVQPSDGKILVGGNFSTYSGATAQGIIRLNTNGSIDTSFTTGGGFDPFNGSLISSIVVQPSDNKILVGGIFTTYSGVTVSNNIIRLNTNGTVDSTFHSGTGFDTGFAIGVSTIAVQPDNKIIVGGDFSIYSGITSAPQIIRLNTNGTVDNTFNAGNNAFNGNTVTSIVVRSSDSKILVGGDFTKFGTTNQSYLTELGTTGIQDGTFPILNVGFSSGANISTIAVQTNNKPIIGGTFTTYSGASYNNIIRLNTDNSIDTTFIVGNGFTGGVSNTIVIQPSDGKILVGGSFTTYSGVTKNRIVRLNTIGTIDSTFSIGTGFGSTVSAIAVQPSDNKILVGGAFTTFTGATQNRLIRLNVNGGKDTTFAIGTAFNNAITSILIQPDNKIIVGGSFTTYTGTTQNRIIRLNTNGSKDTTFAVGTAFNSSITCGAIQSDGKIIIGGGFTTFTGATYNRIIRLNSNGSVDTTFAIGSGLNSSPSSIVIQSNGKILVTGAFTTYNGVTKNKFVRLNSDGSIDTTLIAATGFDNTANIAAIQGTNILVGGVFTKYDTSLRISLARFTTGTINRIIVTSINGLEYASDFSANYSNRSLVDSAYLTATVAAVSNISITGATNGITKNGKLLKLGGNLTGSTTIGIGINNLTFSGTTGTIKYNADLSANYTPRSIVDKGFVTGLTSQSITSANNGLTKSGQNIHLGGSLTGNTTLNLGSNNLILTGTSGTLRYGSNLSAFYNVRSLVDKGYVTGLTTPLSTSIAAAFTGATNGLTRLGGLVKLGGVITGTTTISGYTDMNIGFNNLNMFNNYNSSLVFNSVYKNNDNISGFTSGSIVFSMALQPSDSKILIGGAFTTYSGATRSRILRLNTNGTLDTGFLVGSGCDNVVRTIVVQTGDSKILLGGDFTAYSGATKNSIVRLNTNGSIDTSFVTGTGFDNTVFSIAMQSDNKIIVGGAFTAYSGATKNSIVRLNTNGSIDTSFVVGAGFFNGNVRTVAIQPSDGKILVGGSYQLYSGTTQNRIIRLNTNGSIDTSFVVGTGFDSTVNSLRIQNDGKIIATGTFTTYNGSTAKQIVRLNTNGTIDLTFSSGAGVNGDTSSIDVATIQTDSKILIGGAFTTYNGVSKNRIVRLNSNGTIDTTFNVGTGFTYGGGTPEVLAILVQNDNKIIVGGVVDQYNGITTHGYIRLFNKNTVTLSNDYGILYGGNYSSTFTPRSVPDVGYVTGQTFININTDVKVETVGKGIYIKEGVNATMGIITLTGGTAVVNTTKVTTNSRIFLTVEGGTLTNVGFQYINARSAGTSFTIKSSNTLDTSQVGWLLIEPA